MRKLAIIPAKKYSKRLNLKNFKYFNNKPIYKYTLSNLKLSGLFDKIHISSNIKLPALSEKDRDAFIIMGLGFDADWQTIQKRFKTLVKKFHPDKHSGNKKYEDKLKKITLAYSHLKMVMISK